MSRLVYIWLGVLSANCPKCLHQNELEVSHCWAKETGDKTRPQMCHPSYEVNEKQTGTIHLVFSWQIVPMKGGSFSLFLLGRVSSSVNLVLLAARRTSQLAAQELHRHRVATVHTDRHTLQPQAHLQKLNWANTASVAHRHTSYGLHTSQTQHAAMLDVAIFLCNKIIPINSSIRGRAASKEWLSIRTIYERRIHCQNETASNGQCTHKGISSSIKST